MKRKRMVKRKRPVRGGRKKKLSGGGMYFDGAPDVGFLPSGCQLLDCALGGGWAERRVANIVGDESTGKTLLAIEACANFARKYRSTPGARIRYNETEGAFDAKYAERVGLPMDMVEFPEEECLTAEQMFDDLDAAVHAVGDAPLLYVVDSLDALSDTEEVAHADKQRKAKKKGEVTKGTYGMGKPKIMSRLFRQLVKKMSKKNVTVLIVSQTRDKIGVTFGEKKTRSGGKALNFYASQIVWLAKRANERKEKKSKKRVIGVNITAKVKKNKVGPAFREADFLILFNFGIDDMKSCVDFLKETNELDRVGLEPTKTDAYLRGLLKMSDAEYDAECDNVTSAVSEVWREIEKSFEPVRRKYR